MRIHCRSDTLETLGRDEYNENKNKNVEKDKEETETPSQEC